MIRPVVRVTTGGTRTGAVELALFRRLVRNLILASHPGRPTALAKVVGYLKVARDADHAIGELLFECADRGGPDGLDIATDVLSQVGHVAVRYARRLLTTDGPKWRVDGSRRVTGNVWYALLRGLCQSRIGASDKVIPVVSAALRGTASIREAAVHALGDLAEYVTPPQRERLRSLLDKMAAGDDSSEVRESAKTVIENLEG